MLTLRARVLTPESEDTVQWLDDALVSIDDGGRIAAVDPYEGGPVDEDLRPGVLTPGFVDAHVHFPQTRIVGAATGGLLQWLQTSTFPEEARFADIDHARAVASLFATSLAAAGTTLSMVYGSVHAEAATALFEALDRTGLRAIAGPVLMDAHSPDALTVPAEVALPALESLVSTWHGRDGRLQVAVVPRFALSCSRDMLAAAADLAHRHGLWVTTHLAETPDECARACDLFGADDYLRVYENAGLVHDRSVYAHCIHLSDSEWARMAEAGAVVAHCPDSNAFLGSGHMPTGKALAAGVPIALGTDIAAGRTFRVPRIASSAYDNALAVGHSVTPSRLFWWATRGGAQALRHDHVGAIVPGLDADLVLHEVPPWVHDAPSALAALLFDQDAPRPLRTWVRGRPIWRRTGTGTPWA